MAINTFEQIRTLADLLTWRSNCQLDQPAFAFLGPNLSVVATDTYGSLAASAHAIARSILETSAPGETIILAYPPGLSFVRALWGVWAAGCVVAPTYPATNQRNAARLRHIIRETNARVILAPPDAEETFYAACERNERLDENVRWITTHQEPARGVDKVRNPDEQDAAIIQYTSGSAGQPKGVILTHRNILSNSQKIYRSFIHTSKSRGLIWLPPYHDMGLMGGIIQPVYGGFRTCLMSPRTFLRNPLNWLKAISITNASTSGGPNFAYELCVGIPAADVEAAKLQLDGWEAAFNGAEPVSSATMEAFTRKYEPYGFKLRRFMPCYGLAESTLYVSGALKVRSPTFLSVEREALRNYEVRVARGAADSQTLVSNGTPDDQVRIVHPEELRPCRATEIGEIWVSGESLGIGYQSDCGSEESRFPVHVGHDGTKYLRTGDLGFLYGGELYVIGRLKDLIIIRGRNHYPEDIEATVRSSHPAFQSLLSAALSITVAETEQSGEQLVVVQEVPRGTPDAEHNAMIEAIRMSVSTEHGLSVSTVMLTPRGGIPKTLNGKVRRSDCRDRFLDGSLSTVARWTKQKDREYGAPDTEIGPEAIVYKPSPNLSQLSDADAVIALSAWLMEVFSEVVQIPIDELDADTHFGLYGLDSLTAVNLTVIVSTELHFELEDTSLWDYPNFNLLATHLTKRVLKTETVEIELGTR